MGYTVIDGNLFAEMVREGAANLKANKQIVNDLNVFPIPDGDTGDNMFMTIDSGATAVGSEHGGSLGSAAAKVAQGMLLGARGNSGVILSRFFAGISKSLENVESADVKTLHRAFEKGVGEAYGAVSVPVEGTILTVFKDAVRFAGLNINDKSTYETYFADFLDELRKSLDRTPDLLPVLKNAGVVDSGGAGFVYIAEGMKNVIDGTSIGEKHPEEAATTTKKSVDVSKFTEDSVLEFGYCTEFLLRLQNAKIDVSSFNIGELTDYLNSVGNSVVAFKDGTIVKVHVHTMTPGEVLNHCQQYGEFLTLKIENMTLQHSEVKIENRYTPAVSKPRKKYGVVSVAAGKGIKETFLSLGCDEVVDGGQSMNPSAEDFIHAFDNINAETIFVFPNNGNIIMTANQAASIYEKAEVVVIPSKTIGEGYAAISMFDGTTETKEQITDEMNEIIAGVVTGIVSKAVRDTEKDGVNVRQGDYIGFVGGKIYLDEPDKNTAAIDLARALGAGTYDIAIVVCGEDVTEEEAGALYAAMGETFKRTETIMIDGGQPIYDYIIILE